MDRLLVSPPTRSGKLLCYSVFPPEYLPMHNSIGTAWVWPRSQTLPSPMKCLVWNYFLCCAWCPCTTDCLVAEWLKHWTADLEVQVLALLATGIFSLQGTLSPGPKNWGEGLLLCPLEGTLSRWSQGTWFKIGSCLPQALISHHCGKPFRANRNKNKQETWT